MNILKAELVQDHLLLGQYCWDCCSIVTKLQIGCIQTWQRIMIILLQITDSGGGDYRLQQQELLPYQSRDFAGNILKICILQAIKRNVIFMSAHVRYNTGSPHQPIVTITVILYRVSFILMPAKHNKYSWWQNTAIFINVTLLCRLVLIALQASAKKCEDL